MTQQPDKDVYIFGAGFSREAKLPLQPEILPSVFARRQSTRDKLFRILDTAFSSGPDTALEDVFTLFDLVISGRQYCVGFHWTDVEAARRDLIREMMFVFHDALKEIPVRERCFYDGIAAYLLEKRLSSGHAPDTLAVISLNWDSLFEESVYRVLNESKGLRKADVDFCCYTNRLSSKCAHTNSLVQKSLKIFNLKLLKLHGSISWLLCPNCNRLFVELGGTELDESKCLFPEVCDACRLVCSRRGAADSYPAPLLEPFIITPTFRKEFLNPHVQMIWYNAHINLAEADRIVFVGYSLPDADYHIRALLKRSVSKSTAIDLVLPPGESGSLQMDRKDRTQTVLGRYELFFGKDRVKAHFSGVKGYFRSKIGSAEKAASRTTYLRDEFRKIKTLSR
jgi:hypothetical protein